MSTISFPAYLTNVPLPLMQTAVAAVVQVHFPEVATIATLVSQYFCRSDELETMATIAFFKEKIPSATMNQMKQGIPEVRACLEDSPSKEVNIPQGSFPLKQSNERKLVTLICLFFTYRNRLFKNTLNQAELSKLEKDNPEYYDFLGRIQGSSILQRCDQMNDPRLCHTFIFGHHDWYKTIEPNDVLLTEPGQVLTFLESKGYKRSKKPCVDQVVVYHSKTTTHHFAKIVDLEGGITVVSKFGRFHIYQHRIALAQFHYGNSVTFLDVPK